MEQAGASTPIDAAIAADNVIALLSIEITLLSTLHYCISVQDVSVPMDL